jgi:hypothetical protein
MAYRAFNSILAAYVAAGGTLLESLVAELLATIVIKCPLNGFGPEKRLVSHPGMR